MSQVLDWDVSVFAYPWDVLDEGVVNFTKQCRRLGLTSVSVTAAYHSGKFLLPRRSKQRVYFPEPGVVYFPADVGGYGDIKPQLGTFANDQPTFFDQLALACREEGLSLKAWVVVFHNSRLATNYPEYAIENVFGDRYTFALCPLRPPARQFMRTLVAELAERYAFTAIQLESPAFSGYTHGHHHELAGQEVGPVERFLLSLCFCPACMGIGSANHIPMASLRDRISRLVDERLNGRDSVLAMPKDRTAEVASLLVADEDLYRFVKLRNAAVTEGLREVSNSLSGTGAPQLELFSAVFARPSANNWIEGIDLRAWSQLAARTYGTPYFYQMDHVTEDIVHFLELTGGPEKTGLCFNLSATDNPELEDALAKVQRALALGVRHFAFYNYGMLGRARLTWLRSLVDAISNAPRPSAPVREARHV